MSRIRGLYAVTDGAAEGDALLEAVEQALRGGAAVVQYRDKQGGPQSRGDAAALAALCREFAVPFLINDDVALASRAGADGVHLGRDDRPPAEAREVLGRGALIGVSCYNQLARAVAAEAAGVDYVAFGRFFPSRTKPSAVQAEVSLLREARRVLTVPVVAIGGITPDNGAELVQAGADALAVIHGLFGQQDVNAAARRFQALFA